MKARSRTIARNLLLSCALILPLLFAVQAEAGGGGGGGDISEETCAALGYLLVKCYDCSSGSNVLKGGISWPSKYTSDYGGSCFSDREAAFYECGSQFDLNGDYEAIFSEYYIDFSKKSAGGWSPNCPELF